MANNSWQRKGPILALTLAVIAAGVVAWQQAGEQTHDAMPLTSSIPSHTLPPSPSPAETPAPTPKVVREATPEDQHEHDSVPASFEDRQAKLLSKLGELEREFLSEPISETWRGSTETMISESLSEDRLASNEAPIPVSHESECRSKTCRIRVTYRSEMEAQMGEIFLLGGIAERLPTANFGRLISPDGSVQIVMYANTGPARRQR